MARQRLLRAVKALVETGATPPGIDAAAPARPLGVIVLPPDQPYKDGAREALIALPGVAPASYRGRRSFNEDTCFQMRRRCPH